MESPKNYYGFAFTLPSTDDRRKDYLKQIDERGFDDTETWDLSVALGKFLLPRLKRLNEIQIKTIIDPELQKDVEQMIEGFQLLSDDDTMEEESHNKISIGFELLSKNWSKLWW